MMNFILKHGKGITDILLVIAAINLAVAVSAGIYQAIH